MHPYLLRAGELSLPAYPVIYGLGITLASIVIVLLGARQGLNVRKLAHVSLFTALAVVIGGRAFYVLQHISAFEGHWDQAVDISEGGQVLYGGLILAALVVIVSCRLNGLPLKSITDLTAVAAPLGLALGRLACFCRGCCYGKISDLPWAVEFPKFIDLTGHIAGSPPYVRHLDLGLITDTSLHSLPVHPAQLYSSFLSLVVFFAMLELWRRRWLAGCLLPVYLILYSMSRFGIEFTRDNELAFWGLTIPQVVSLAIAVGSFSVLAATRRRTFAASMSCC
jgi:phosphatidylglycerol:prolipoprotein diacylglycerol transferase